MREFDVLGMGCAACVAKVEKAVSKVPGVTNCSVSLLTNSMSVEGDASDEKIIKAVTEAGYKASLRLVDITTKELPKDRNETKEMLVRLIASVFLLAGLIYFTVIKEGIFQLALCLLIMIIHRRFFVNGWKGVIHLAPNMDTLISLGSGISFIYSVIILFTSQSDMLHFESAAMILVFISIGKTLENYSKGKTTDALQKLIAMTPKTARVIRDGEEFIIDASFVKRGETFIVLPGESIPVDGVVKEGYSSVNEASLTGESMPVSKSSGDMVSAATINQLGTLTCEASAVGEDTVFAGIIKMVREVSATKAPVQRLADKVAGIFVPTVIGIALITFIIRLLAGADFSYALTRAITVLIISCPCSLGLATPVAIMVGNGTAARKGTLFKTAASLEMAGRVDVVAFDKTGTVTVGKPQIAETYVNQEKANEGIFLAVAGALEKRSEHPLSTAVLEFIGDMDCPDIKGMEAVPGKGVKGFIHDDVNEEDVPVFGGSLSFIEECTTLTDNEKEIALRMQEKGRTTILFATGEYLLGIMGAIDPIKEDAVSTIKVLSEMGISTVMLTGDNEVTAKTLAREAGISSVYAELLPGDKSRIIENLKKDGKHVAMVGDGINDAPALTMADLGIAVKNGTDIAMDSADVILMNTSLSQVCTSLAIGRKTLRVIRGNLFWAFFYNCIGIPIAAIFTLPPMFGALAMSLSSVCVCLNALRLMRE